MDLELFLQERPQGTESTTIYDQFFAFYAFFVLARPQQQQQQKLSKLKFKI